MSSILNFDSARNQKIDHIFPVAQQSNFSNRSFESIQTVTKKLKAYKSTDGLQYESQNRKDMIESIQRRFQLELQKQKQFSSLLVNKLSQQNDFLKLQNQSLKLINQKLKNSLDDQQNVFISQKTRQSSATKIMSSTEKLKNMLQNLELEHQNCITIKKDLLNKIETQQIKIKVLMQENAAIQLETRQSKKHIQTLKDISTQNESYRKQIQTLKKENQSLRSSNNLKQLQFNKQLHQLQKSIQSLSIKTQIQETKQKKNDQNQPFYNQTTKQAFQRNKKKQIYTQCPLEQKQIIEGLYKRNLYHLSSGQAQISKQKVNSLNKSSEIKGRNRQYLMGIDSF